MRPRYPDQREIVAPQRAIWLWIAHAIVIVVIAAKLGLVAVVLG